MDRHYPCLFQTLIGSEHCPPILFKGQIDCWPARTWTVQYLNQILGDKQLKCKISSLSVEDMLWETECQYVFSTLCQYVEWLDKKPREDNPLKHVDPSKFSCYIDYKYMNDVFENKPEMLKGVNWDMFGLTGRDGSESTIWIGSTGAYTPCHQDSYGFNLVAQISGRKRWYLFDPRQSQSMYAIRIPYEESSVFSEVNVRAPDLYKHPLFQKTTPYIVELIPGDVLYVPRHWWHFVESLEQSISINTWVPLAEDKISHVYESISRLLFTCLSNHLLCEREQALYVNSTEELQLGQVNLGYVQTAIHSLTESKHQGNKNQTGSQHQGNNSLTGNQHQGSNNLSGSQYQDLKHLCKMFQDETVDVADLSKHQTLHCTKVRKYDGESSAVCDVSVSPAKRHCREKQEVQRTEIILPSIQQIETPDQMVSKVNSRITASKCMQFKDFLDFLKKEFNFIDSCSQDNSNIEEVDYNVAEQKSSMESLYMQENANVTCSTISEGSDNSGGDQYEWNGGHVTARDVISSVLDPDVVKHIVNVLIDKGNKKC